MPKSSEWISERLHNPLTVQEGATFGKIVWFSEQELQDKLKKAEKRIDKIQVSSLRGRINPYKLRKKVKEILNEVFGN